MGSSGRHRRRKQPSTSFLGVKLTPDELEAAKASARSAGLSVSDYVRARILDKPVVAKSKVPQVNVKVYAELARSASNLNQLAHHLNEGRIMGLPRKTHAKVLKEELRRMYGHVTALRRHLVGAGHDSRSK